MSSFSPVPPPEDRVRPIMRVQYARAETLDIIAQPTLARLAQYWLSRRNGAELPLRSSIDPLDMPWALPKLYLVDCVRVDPATAADGGHWRYRYRLAGEQIEAMYITETRASIRGQWLDDIIPADGIAAVMERWRPLPEQHMVLYMHGMIYRLSHRVARGGRLMLPLCDEPGGPCTSLLGATEYDWVDLSKQADIVITQIPAAGLP